MRKLIEFIRSIYVVVLFVVLEIVAVGYYARSSYYTQARLLAHSNQVVGGVHGVFTGMKHYFSLGRENRLLLAHVAELRERLSQYEEVTSNERLDSCMADIGLSKYRAMSASVVSNTVNRTQNLIILNRGRRDGVTPEMAVLTPDGAMAGYVVDCNDSYSVALSVLNTSFRASGKIVDTDYFGSISWDGLDQSVVVLDEVSKYADPQPGQEVVSTGFSQYFPIGVKIGTIESAELNETRTAYMIRVRLVAELSRLTDVLLIENRDLQQIRDMEQSDAVRQLTRDK